MKRSIVATLLATAIVVSFQQEAQSQQRQQKLSGGPQDSYQLWKASPTRVVKMDPATKAREIQKDLSSEAYSELRESAQAAVDLPGTTALALVDKGVLVFEGYALGKGASPEGRFVSMSVAKSVTALAVGEAFCAGKIKDLADKAENYAPSLRGTSYGESSVRDLLMMASGAKSGTVESHGQPHPTATRENLLGSRTIAEHIEQFKDHDRTAGDAVLSGKRFAYNNLDTAALAFVVQGATGMPFHKWTQQTIVEKSGFADSSYWQVDRDGQQLRASIGGLDTSGSQHLRVGSADGYDPARTKDAAIRPKATRIRVDLLSLPGPTQWRSLWHGAAAGSGPRAGHRLYARWHTTAHVL